MQFAYKVIIMGLKLWVHLLRYAYDYYQPFDYGITGKNIKAMVN